MLVVAKACSTLVGTDQEIVSPHARGTSNRHRDFFFETSIVIDRSRLWRNRNNTTIHQLRLNRPLSGINWPNCLSCSHCRNGDETSIIYFSHAQNRKQPQQYFRDAVVSEKLHETDELFSVSLCHIGVAWWSWRVIIIIIIVIWLNLSSSLLQNKKLWSNNNLLQNC